VATSYRNLRNIWSMINREVLKGQLTPVHAWMRYLPYVGEPRAVFSRARARRVPAGDLPLSARGSRRQRGWDAFRRGVAAQMFGLSALPDVITPLEPMLDDPNCMRHPVIGLGLGARRRAAAV
jgi:hypothetical protein